MEQLGNWAEFFEMATLSRLSIPISEVLKTLTEQNPSILSLLGDFTVATATKKVVIFTLTVYCEDWPSDVN